jgi:hypothetical protein
MTEDEKMEFWKALGRLYDETLLLRESIADLRQVAEAHQRVVERHQFVLEVHETRLDRLDERGREPQQ